MRLFAIGALVGALSSGCFQDDFVVDTAPDKYAELDRFLTTKLEDTGGPGMAVGVLARDGSLWVRGYGERNVRSGRPVTVDTPFILASVSKLVAGVALMQLYDDGRFDLDDDVNEVLPFPVRNPRFPDAPITYRMLLTHASSLLDGDSAPGVEEAEGDSDIPLGTWLREYVTPGGEYYEASNWARERPGTVSEYSNAGASLVGHLVEVLSGQDLQAFCAARLFGPLGMRASSWFMRGLDGDKVAMPYQLEGSRFVAQGHYGVPDYPDGQLRSSVSDLGRFLAMLRNGGELGGTRVLRESTVAEMLRVQDADLDEDQGLMGYYQETDGKRCYGHTGAYLGASTDAYFDPVSGAGFVFLSNGGTYYDEDEGRRTTAIETIEARLLRAAMGASE